ncbi:hypothetical protein CHR55_26235 [Rhodococcus qingshengii]|uniref:Uncharacterized protein n=2 Tax=Rhodococcus qingshengii TaxID=334542 RepID=A0A2A5J5Y1_RHOSG|nr:hypothetical protein CHR55_26235 [Rhodococcus qingshengii]
MYYMCGEKQPAVTAGSVSELIAEAQRRGWSAPALIAAKDGDEWTVNHWVYARTDKPVSNLTQAAKYYNVRIGITEEWPHRLGPRPTDDGLS